jgi:hypothetical protein
MRLQYSNSCDQRPNCKAISCHHRYLNLSPLTDNRKVLILLLFNRMLMKNRETMDLPFALCEWGLTHKRELRGARHGGARRRGASGRDKVNPSTTHLRDQSGEMCRRGACPHATLAVACGPTAKCALTFAPMGLAPPSGLSDSRCIRQRIAGNAMTREVHEQLQQLVADFLEL